MGKKVCEFWRPLLADTLIESVNADDGKKCQELFSSFVITSSMKRILALLCFLSLTLSIYAQNQYKLNREDSGHYYFNTTINGSDAHIMLESAIPALLIGRDYYEQHMKDCGISFTDTQAKIRLMANVYTICLKADGLISIGDNVYDGPIWVLEDFNGLRMPVQYLKNSAKGRSTITISFSEGWMNVGEDKAAFNNTPYKLGLDKSTACPFVESAVKISTSAGCVVVKGPLNIDFGNPMLLALVKTHKKIAGAIKAGDILVTDARNREGKVVAQGIYAEHLSLLGKDYEEMSILMLPQWNNKKIMGLLGLPFFQNTVFLDFDKHIMIVE